MMNMDMVEVPEVTPFQKMEIYEGRINRLNKELRLMEAQLKQTSSIFKKLQLWREIRGKRNLLDLYRLANRELMNEWEIR